MVGPELGDFPQGFSVYDSPEIAPLTRHNYEIPAGTTLPDNLAIKADGLYGMPGSTLPEGHNTIFPLAEMSFQHFVDTIMSINWTYAGKK
jgi:hypothetical protein